VNSCVVAISNCLFSFVAGFAVFATLGHLAFIENLESISQLEYSSFGLVFGSWPVTLVSKVLLCESKGSTVSVLTKLTTTSQGTLPGGEHWIRLLFVMLFLLGIDSAFSFMEGFLTVLGDTKAFQNVNRKLTSFVLAMGAFLLSLIYATDAGLIFLDTIDYYINFVMLLVGGFECFSAGWVYRIEDQIESLGTSIVLAHIGAFFGAVILACCLWFGLSNADDALWAGFVGLVCFYVIGMVFVVSTTSADIVCELDRIS
jgi:SNF family Na+-dependent transporter